jgi:cell wall-associated NlpC family hydrolase
MMKAATGPPLSPKVDVYIGNHRFAHAVNTAADSQVHMLTYDIWHADI